MCSNYFCVNRCPNTFGATSVSNLSKQVLPLNVYRFSGTDIPTIFSGTAVLTNLLDQLFPEVLWDQKLCRNNCFHKYYGNSCSHKFCGNIYSQNICGNKCSFKICGSHCSDNGRTNCYQTKILKKWSIYRCTFKDYQISDRLSNPLTQDKRCRSSKRLYILQEMDDTHHRRNDPLAEAL